MNTTACLLATDTCNPGLLIPYTLTGMNPYDMRIKCVVAALGPRLDGAPDSVGGPAFHPGCLTVVSHCGASTRCAKPPLCYDFSNVATYLDRPEVRALHCAAPCPQLRPRPANAACRHVAQHAATHGAYSARVSWSQVRAHLGVGTRKWSDCSHAVALEFELAGDWMHNFQDQLPDQLAAGIRVLMYAGDQDYICNWLGNQAWIKALQWPGRAAFNAASLRNISTATGAAIGSLRTAQGLSFLQVPLNMLLPLAGAGSNPKACRICNAWAIAD